MSNFGFCSIACPKEYPYAHDKNDYRNKCSDAAGWNFIDPQMPPEFPEVDENGNELPFQDRVQDFPAQVVSCPHFPTPCTDAAGELMLRYVQC